MGVSVSLAESQEPLFHSAAVVLTRDESGAEVLREQVDENPMVLSMVHFVILDDGRRLTTEKFGEMALQISADIDEEELRAEAREFILGDEMRDIPELADEPRWEEMVEVLSEHGLEANEDELAVLPFDVEIDEEVMQRVRD
jgi:hypothetical protein